MKPLLFALLLGSALAHAEGPPPQPETAVFAGGCFWCVEADFEKLPGVIGAVSGYTGGTIRNPTYEQVGAGGSGHFEAVQVSFDPAQISYEKLLDYFWHHHDPTDGAGQFCDKGEQYRAVIFYRGEAQKKSAEHSLARLKASRRFPQITTTLAAAGPFWPAEEYHQDYYKKNPLRYRYYRSGCGRDRTLERLWGP